MTNEEYKKKATETIQSAIFEIHCAIASSKYDFEIKELEDIRNKLYGMKADFEYGFLTYDEGD